MEAHLYVTGTQTDRYPSAEQKRNSFQRLEQVKKSLNIKYEFYIQIFKFSKATTCITKTKRKLFG